MTGTGAHDGTKGPGPGGHAAARLHLLTEETRSGPPRRAALANLTDDWLAGLFAAGAEGARGVFLVAVGGYGRAGAVPAGPDRTARRALRGRRAARCGTAHRRTRPGGRAARGGRGARRAPADRTHRGASDAGPPAGVDGSVLLLDWRVAAEYGSLPQATRLRADLVRALDGSLDIVGRLAERDAAYPRRRGAAAPPARVTVAPAASRHATVVEVRAQDAPGLLFRIGRALEDAGVRVRSAQVSTLGANAVDAFYVTCPEGTPLPGEEAGAVARKLEETLRA